VPGFLTGGGEPRTGSGWGAGEGADPGVAGSTEPSLGGAMESSITNVM